MFFNELVFCTFMIYNLCRSVLIASHKPTKLGSQWERISFLSNNVDPSYRCSTSACDPHERGIFVVSAAVLQWHGVLLCVMRGGHAGKLSFSPLPALGWGE